MIIEMPLSQEQIERLQTVSDKQIRDAQDALFMYLINRVNELEKREGEKEKGEGEDKSSSPVTPLPSPSKGGD